LPRRNDLDAGCVFDGAAFAAALVWNWHGLRKALTNDNCFGAATAFIGAARGLPPAVGGVMHQAGEHLHAFEPRAAIPAPRRRGRSRRSSGWPMPLREGNTHPSASPSYKERSAAGYSLCFLAELGRRRRGSGLRIFQTNLHLYVSAHFQFSNPRYPCSGG
jgi:hypothetical protein